MLLRLYFNFLFEMDFETSTAKYAPFWPGFNILRLGIDSHGLDWDQQFPFLSDTVYTTSAVCWTDCLDVHRMKYLCSALMAPCGWQQVHCLHIYRKNTPCTLYNSYRKSFWIEGRNERWIKFNSLLGKADSEVHIIQRSRVVIAYTLESLSSLT